MTGTALSATQALQLAQWRTGAITLTLKPCEIINY